MDWADRAVAKQGQETHTCKDVLEGYDIIKEYDKIKAGKSTLHSRIQSLIIQRYTTGR